MPGSCIYIFPSSPIFNKEEIKVFPNFDVEHSSLLFSTLYLNHLDIIQPLMNDLKVVCCFDNKDKEHLPSKLHNDNIKLFFNDTSDKHTYFKTLNEKYLKKHQSNLLIFSNSISMCLSDIQKVFNLLAIDDEVVVLGKSHTNKLCFIGFNNYNNVVSKKVNWNQLDYEDTLNIVCKNNILVHVLEKYYTINTVEDFKTLYNELSKKESIVYCNDDKHEHFTHLFIEYKGLLK